MFLSCPVGWEAERESRRWDERGLVADTFQAVSVQLSAPLTFLVEKCFCIFAILRYAMRYSSQELDYVGQMVVIATVIIALVRLEQVITGGQLEGHTSGAPNVSRKAIPGAEYHF